MKHLFWLALLAWPGLAWAQTGVVVNYANPGGPSNYVTVSPANPLPVSGTSTVSGTVTLGTGSAVVGKVGIDQTTPGVTNAIVIAPTSAAAAGITPVVSTAAEGGHVLKGSPGNLYSVYATTGAAAGYLMIFNATTVPADGAVTPIECVYVPASATTSINYGSGPPAAASAGISVAFSTTGCFTKTSSATAFFHGNVQ